MYEYHQALMRMRQGNSEREIARAKLMGRSMSRGTQFSPLMGIENSPPGSGLGLLRTDEAGFQLLFQPVRVATNVQRDGVMQ